MRHRKRGSDRRRTKFFRIVGIPNSIINFYKTNFNLIHKYHYALSDLMELIPWERDSYVGMLMDHLDKQKEQ
jgi:hypothetical protein